MPLVTMNQLTGFSFPATLAMEDAMSLSWPACPNQPLKQASAKLKRACSDISLASTSSIGSNSDMSTKLCVTAKESMSKSVRRFIKREGCKLFCGICKREFTWENSLVRHIVCVHAGIKKFFCQRCGKSFKGNHGLKYHMSSKICFKPVANHAKALNTGKIINNNGMAKLRKLNIYNSMSSTDSTRTLDSLASTLSMGDNMPFSSGALKMCGATELPPTTLKPPHAECVDSIGKINAHHTATHSAHQFAFCPKAFNSKQSLQGHKDLVHHNLYFNKSSSTILEQFKPGATVDYDFMSNIYDINTILAWERIKQQQQQLEQVHATPLLSLGSVSRQSPVNTFAVSPTYSAANVNAAPSISPNTNLTSPTPYTTLQSSMRLQQIEKSAATKEASSTSSMLVRMLKESLAGLTPSPH